MERLTNKREVARMGLALTLLCRVIFIVPMGKERR